MSLSSYRQSDSVLTTGGRWFTSPYRVGADTIFWCEDTANGPSTTTIGELSAIGFSDFLPILQLKIGHYRSVLWRVNEPPTLFPAPALEEPVSNRCASRTISPTPEGGARPDGAASSSEPASRGPLGCRRASEQTHRLRNRREVPPADPSRKHTSLESRAGRSPSRREPVSLRRGAAWRRASGTHRRTPWVAQRGGA